MTWCWWRQGTTLEGHSHPRSSISRPQPPFSPQLASSFTQSRIGLFHSGIARNPFLIVFFFSVSCVCDLYPVQRHSWPAITFSTSPRLGLDSAWEIVIWRMLLPMIVVNIIVWLYGLSSILNLNSKLIQMSYMHIHTIQVKDKFDKDALNSRLDTWRRVFAAMTTPGVQKPHWLPACLTNEVWQ